MQQFLESMTMRALGVPVWLWVLALIAFAWWLGPQTPSMMCGPGLWRC